MLECHSLHFVGLEDGQRVSSCASCVTAWLCGVVMDVVYAAGMKGLKEGDVRYIWYVKFDGQKKTRTSEWKSGQWW